METIVQKAWSKSKSMVKAITIAILILLLQIPTYFIRDLIQERETRQAEAINEVSSKWAGTQNISGPYIVLPYLEDRTDSLKSKKHYAYFLPDELNIKSAINPLEKHRGIYKVMLYNASINESGSYTSLNPDALNIIADKVIWKEASVRMLISDLKGLNDEFKINWNDKILTLTPQMINKEPVLAANLNVSSFDDLKNIRFTSSFNINGSGQILFTPLGKITTVKIDSKWPHPSFNGNSLPQTAQVNEHGFSAVWKSLAHNRNFPQQWKDDDYALSAQSNEVNDSQIIAAAAFGADLYVPVNAYQKTMRSIKYAILCILLTFVSFYLIETTNRKSIHPLQYALIGFALVLFYTLLLSFSEYIGFNYSYIIASLFTISLIAWFVKGLLSSSRLSIILSGVLVLIYTYIFTILQLQDYALLVGSIGLFIALGIIMHFSKKIQW